MPSELEALVVHLAGYVAALSPLLMVGWLCIQRVRMQDGGRLR